MVPAWPCRCSVPSVRSASSWVAVSTPHFLLAACSCARPEQIRVDLRRLPSRAGLELRNEMPHIDVVIIKIDALILEEIEDPD